MSELIGPATEVVKCAGPPFVRQISYFLYYKKNVEKLRKRVQELNNTRRELQKRVDEAENNLESIKKSVLDWFESVDKETTQGETTLRLLNDDATFEMINQQCCKGWCCCRVRWNVGRDAQKKLPIIDELLNQGKSFGNNVSNPSLPVGTQFIPTNEDFEEFESRESSKKQLIAALKDDETCLVKVYGMGGVGKTMLVNQVSGILMQDKLFDVVATTTVSEKVNLNDIQNEIASQLGLKRLEETKDSKKRAAMLQERLMMPNKKFMVILDDMLSTELISLSDVGIPYGKTCCKVVITTKIFDVCNSLRSRDIEVKVLTEEESWDLFKKNVGEDVLRNSPELETVARDVAKECGGLPVALVTMGRSLVTKDKYVWIDTAYQLQNSDFSSMGEIDSKVFKSIKLSYNHLGNEILKKCFLICSLFPEDYRISIDELMMHVMGDYEIFKNMKTIKHMRDRLHAILDKLMASCLLLGHKPITDGGITKVWMHDIVRYVALIIASEDGSGFYGESGAGLEDWPDKRRLLSRSSANKRLRLSVMKNEISELPEQPELPHLLCLSLEGNKPLKKIPDRFFQEMESLASLNLSGTGITSLPSSLSCLVHLRSLNLDYCAIIQPIDISLIGRLRKLEILSLQHCRLSILPIEIGRLVNLKSLNISNNPDLHTLPPNVISSMSRLEELYMMKSFSKWRVFEGAENATNASLDEVTNLKGLNALHLDVTNEQMKLFVSMDRVSEKRAVKYHWIETRFHFFLTTSLPVVCHSIKVLLERVDSLILNECAGLKNVGQLSSTGVGFNNLKSLFVRRCLDMEYLMSVVEDDQISSSRTTTTTTTPSAIALERLHLLSLDKLKEIIHIPKSAAAGLLGIRKQGIVPFESLQNLKVVTVENCNALTYLFSQAMAWSLPQLEELKIWECQGMVTIIVLSDDDQEMVLERLFKYLYYIIILTLPLRLVLLQLIIARQRLQSSLN